MTKGWYGNSQKHSLASRGITTKIELNYYKNKGELVFFDFWKANIKNDYSVFDFESAYEFFRETLEDKLAQFGQRGFDEWNGQMDEYAVEYMEEVLINQGIEPDDEYGDKWEKQIYQFYEEDRKNGLKGEYVKEWNELLDKINNPPINHLEKILLMDRLIHMEHENGEIFNIDSLRDEFDKWYTGVRRFR